MVAHFNLETLHIMPLIVETTKPQRKQYSSGATLPFILFAANTVEHTVAKDILFLKVRQRVGYSAFIHC